MTPDYTVRMGPVPKLEAWFPVWCPEAVQIVRSMSELGQLYRVTIGDRRGS